MRGLFAPYRELVVAWALGTTAMGLALLSQPSGWTHVWPMASAVADKGVLFAAPVLAATSCLMTQRRRRTRPADLLGALPRRGTVRRLVDVGRYALVAVAVAVTAHAVAWTTAVAHGAYGEPIWRYAVLSMTTLVVMATVGHVVGRCTRRWAAGLAVGFATLGAIVLWPRTGVMDFWYVVSVWPQLTVSPTVLTGRVALAATVVGAIAVGSRHALWRSWSALMAVVCMTMLVSTLGAPTALREPAGRACTDGQPQVCVWPDNAWYLPLVASSADRVRQAVAGTVPLPVDPLLDEGLGDGDDPEAGSAPGSAVVVRMGRSEVARTIAAAWIDTSPSCPGAAPDGDEAWDARHRWETWVHGRLTMDLSSTPGTAGLSASDGELLEEVRSWPEPDQIAWAGEQALAAQGCPS